MQLPKKILFAFLFFLLLLTGLVINPSTVNALGEPIKISDNANDNIYPQTLTDSKGYLHLVWQEYIIDTPSNPGIFYSRWNGDTWAAPLKISENTGYAEIPTLAVDSSDTVHVVWDDNSYDSEEVLPKIAYKTRSFAGTWSAIEILPSVPDHLAPTLPNIAIDGSGQPNVTFSAATLDGASRSIFWTKKVAGTWSTPEVVSHDVEGNVLTKSQWSILRQDASGNLHLAYWDTHKGIFYRKYSSGSWSTPVLLSNASNLKFPRLSVTPLGEVFVAWVSFSDSSVRVRWTQSGVWQTETTLTTAVSTPYYNSGIIGVTTDSKERAHVGWGEKDAEGKIDIRYRSFAAGTWQPVQDVDLDNNDAMMPFVFPDKWDNQHFTWSELNPVSGKWEIYYRVAEGTVKSIGTAGGTVTANPSGTTYAQIVIPSGALTQTELIAIQIGPVPESIDPTQVTIPRSITFRPHGLVFADGKTATSTVYYTNAEIGAVDETTLKPWYWNSQTNNWEAKTGTVNTTANTIDVTLTGFSLYGISGKIVTTVFQSPRPNQSLKYTGAKALFSLYYADFSPFRDIIDSEDLKMVLKNSMGSTVKTYLYNVHINKIQGSTFSADLNVSPFIAPPGMYTIEVLLTGNKVGEVKFFLAP